MPTFSGNSTPYPSPDEALGEKLFPDEAALTDQLADTIEKDVRAQYKAGSARRDVHSKATGILEAEFRVNDPLPDDLAKGIFIPGKVYQAWIRFSNGSGNPNQSDNIDDARGMAIKLLDVPGEKILECDRNATTQDFVMINHPMFLTNDPHTYSFFSSESGQQQPSYKANNPVHPVTQGNETREGARPGQDFQPAPSSLFLGGSLSIGDRTGPASHKIFCQTQFIENRSYAGQSCP